ncbi:hypothetical protein ANCCAN_20199 [Ancylostoma caninum]|uniref:Peptidase A2 domain-containing protein n=1 Tax=Ancylostoma caninum TaxID=29170 RepID=A0A368FP16_ANCCA|nr:hypothetical protein ANCCAN_20199 [Ancylostoma caninum]
MQSSTRTSTVTEVQEAEAEEMRTQCVSTRSDEKELMPKRGSTSHSSRNRQIRRVVAALKKDDHPHLDVTINGHPTQLLFDTGAKITTVPVKVETPQEVPPTGSPSYRKPTSTALQLMEPH